jgi:hypothetical protein
MVGTTGLPRIVLPPSSNDANPNGLGSFQWLAREDALSRSAEVRSGCRHLTRRDQNTVIFVTIFLMQG